MGGVATLERPRTAVPPVAVSPLPLRVDASSATTLLFGTLASAAFALGLATTLVSQFGWRTSMLGAALPYAADAPDAVGWLCVTATVVVATRTLARYGSPSAAGLRVAVAGAALALASSAAALVAVALTATSHPHPSAALLDGLAKTGDGLAAAGLVALGVGVLLARARTSGVWHRTLGLLGMALLVAALNPAYELVTLLSSSSVVRNERLAEALTSGASAVSWLLLAVALGWASAALASDGRTRALGGAVPLAVGGAAFLALSPLATLTWQELQLHATATGWQTRLNEAAPTLGWLGWVALAVAFGVAAVRLARSA